MSDLGGQDLNPNPHLSQQQQDSEPEPKCRPVGGTEYSWCRAVTGGTGIIALAFLLSKQPDIPLFHAAIHELQNAHPLLRSKLRFDPTSRSSSYITPPSSHLQIQELDLPTTLKIISDLHSTSLHHAVLEHELNINPWSSYLDQSLENETDVFFVSLYTVSETQWVLALRMHNSAFDITSAVAVLRELVELVGDGGPIRKENLSEQEVNLAIEDLIPSGKGSKPFWVRGIDMLGYSLNSFRLSNLKYLDTDTTRCSKMVRLRMNRDDTQELLDGCKSRGIKLCGALAAAGLIAAHSTKDLLDHEKEKYAVVTFVDCRSHLDPVLTSHHIGFYHSVILNTHDVSGGDELWELVKRCYAAFANAKSNNKHLTDMSDLNFLMCKAIENPRLTPSSSLRTAFMSVFEDVVISDSNTISAGIGVEDYVGCASVHGVGPSIAVFDTIRDGQLDCALVYPSPLHSREQMEKLIDDMKRILVEGCANLVSDES